MNVFTAHACCTDKSFNDIFLHVHLHYYKGHHQWLLPVSVSHETSGDVPVNACSVAVQQTRVSYNLRSSRQENQPHTSPTVTLQKCWSPQFCALSHAVSNAVPRTCNIDWILFCQFPVWRLWQGHMDQRLNFQRGSHLHLKFFRGPQMKKGWKPLV